MRTAYKLNSYQGKGAHAFKPKNISQVRHRTNSPPAVIISNLLIDDHGPVFLWHLQSHRTRIKTSGGATQKLEYDARGNIVGVVDGNRNRTQYRLDEWEPKDSLAS